MHASSPRAHMLHTGVLPTGGSVEGGSLARARGRARPNLGLHRSRLAPDRNSLCAGAGARGARRVLPASARKTEPDQMHGEGPYPCGKGRPVILQSTTTTLPAPAGQIGPERLQRSGRASGPPWRAGVPPTSAGGAWGYLGLAQRAREHREDVSSSRRAVPHQNRALKFTVS